jgi:hypothetical protein
MIYEWEGVLFCVVELVPLSSMNLLLNDGLRETGFGMRVTESRERPLTRGKYCQEHINQLTTVKGEKT